MLFSSFGIAPSKHIPQEMAKKSYMNTKSASPHLYHEAPADHGPATILDLTPQAQAALNQLTREA